MKKSLGIALAGIGSALALLSLIGAAFLPTANIAFWTFATLCVMIPAFIDARSFIYSLLSFLVVSALALIITGNFLQILPFSLMFCPYAFAWFFFKNKKFSIVIKYLFEYIIFFILITCCYFFLKWLIAPQMNEIDEFLLKWWWIIIIILFGFLPLYNFVLNQGKILIKNTFLKANIRKGG